MFQPLRRYADFEGRASRTEYRLFVLFESLLVIGFLAAFGFASVVAREDSPGVNGPAVIVLALAVLTYLGLFIPRLAVLVRRLHDTGNSGFWILIGLVPLGGFVILVFTLLAGTNRPNAYGSDPRGRGPSADRPHALVLEGVE
jgi:uncharacterized membrane protein YhaH (DUF805 family)